jgi:hypothetical protein
MPACSEFDIPFHFWGFIDLKMILILRVTLRWATSQPALFFLPMLDELMSMYAHCTFQMSLAVMIM